MGARNYILGDKGRFMLVQESVSVCYGVFQRGQIVSPEYTDSHSNNFNPEWDIDLTQNGT